MNARDAMPNGGVLTIATTRVEIDAEQASCVPAQLQKLRRFDPSIALFRLTVLQDQSSELVIRYFAADIPSRMFRHGTCHSGRTISVS